MSPQLSCRSLLAILALASCVSGFTTTAPDRSHRTTIALAMSEGSSSRSSNPKNSDRAHIERNLEEAMDNDWRVFRAKLVAQEKLGASQDKNKKQKGDSSNKNNNDKKKDDAANNNNKPRSQSMVESDVKLQKQAQIGEIFAGALSSIFKSKAPPEPSSDTSIFAGDLVGGAHFLSKAHNSKKDTDKVFSEDDDDSNVIYEDPFVSEAELPILLPKTTIDKHRWAHEIPYIEPGAVLIANEKLGGVFHQTVVLIIEHHENTGTFGVVINRPMEGTLMKVGSEPKARVDLSLKMAFHKSKVAYGGPVLTEEFSVLHSFGEVEGARKLCNGVYIGGSEELMNQVRCGSMNPRHALFVKGHAAWVPGQLNREIQKGVWYTAAVSSDFILRYAGVKLTKADNPNDLWTDILTCMGGKFGEIARRHGGTGDSRRVMP